MSTLDYRLESLRLGFMLLFKNLLWIKNISLKPIRADFQIMSCSKTTLQFLFPNLLRELLRFPCHPHSCHLVFHHLTPELSGLSTYQCQRCHVAPRCLTLSELNTFNVYVALELLAASLSSHLSIFKLINDRWSNATTKPTTTVIELHW